MIKMFGNSLISKEDLKLSSKMESELHKKVIWNSKMIEDVHIAIEKGYDYEFGNPYHEKETGMRAGDVLYEMSEEEMEEYKKCKNDIVYFALKYCKIKDEYGRYDNIKKLRPYQEKFLRLYEDGDINRFIVYMASRQIGKSVMSGIIINHFLCFNYDKNIMIMANKGTTVDEIVDKIRNIYISLPFFIKPGIKKSNMKNIVFDSGNRIMGQTTTKTTAIGFTVDFLYMDEFAHVPENILNHFYKSIFPTISSLKKSRIIITSTPNGENLFYTIYTMAQKKENDYTPYTTYWYEVEGRDEEWKRKEIANLGGDEEAFSQEYDLRFTKSSNALLDSETLKRLRENVIKYEHIVIDSFEDMNIDYKNLKWDLEYYNSSDFQQKKFILLIDLSKGLGKDYSVINILEVCTKTKEEIGKIENPTSEKDFIYLRQVGVFRDNSKSVKDVSVICHLLCDFLGYENVRINLEINFDGDFFIDCMEKYDEFYDDLFFQTKHTINAVYEKKGVRITGDNKINYCNDLKNLLRRGGIVINEEETLKEAERFGINSKGSYSGIGGHDDIFMTLVGLMPSLSSFGYDELVEELFMSYDKDTIDMIYQKLDISETSEYIDPAKSYTNYEGLDMSKYQKFKSLNFGY